jgi:hypothetical protein
MRATRRSDPQYRFDRFLNAVEDKIDGVVHLKICELHTLSKHAETVRRQVQDLRSFYQRAKDAGCSVKQFARRQVTFKDQDGDEVRHLRTDVQDEIYDWPTASTEWDDVISEGEITETEDSGTDEAIDDQDTVRSIVERINGCLPETHDQESQ